MSDVEHELREALRGVPAPSQIPDGPSLRRLARRARLRAQLVGVAVLVAAGAAAVLVLPTLGHRDTEAAGPTSSAPCGRTPPAHPESAAADPITRRWTPAGALVEDPLVVGLATYIAAHDCDYSTITADLLDPAGATIVYAGYVPGFDNDGASGTPRAVVIVAGNTRGPNARPALAYLTTIAGGRDYKQLTSLTVLSVQPSADLDVLALRDTPRDAAGQAWVAARHGVTRAQCFYGDNEIDGSREMRIESGIALCPAVNSNGSQVTRITAYSGSAKVWDAAPATIDRPAAPH